MEEVRIFENAQFGQVRTAGTSEEPLFCLADVCKILGLSAKGVNQRLSDGVISNYPITDSLGRQQLALFVNEDGLYDVILDSRKPEAKAFRKWVTSEVLPSIRKSGGYIAAAPEETPEQIMAKALRIADDTLKRTQAQLSEANQTIDTQNRQIQMAEGQIEEQQKQIKALAPDAQYTQDVLQSDTTYTLTQVSKDLGFVSVYKLTAILKERGILYYQSGQWLPTSKFAGQGYFRTRTTKYVKNDDTIGTNMYTVVTERGRMWLHGLFDKINLDRWKEREKARLAEVAAGVRTLPILATYTIEGTEVTVYETELKNPCIKAQEVFSIMGYKTETGMLKKVGKDNKRKITVASNCEPMNVLSVEGLTDAIAATKNPQATYQLFSEIVRNHSRRIA